MSLLGSTHWITPLFFYQELGNVKVSINASKMKGYILKLIIILQAHRVTSSFFNQVLDKVKVAFLTCKVKWCLSLLGSTHWITPLFFYQELGNVKVSIAASIMKGYILIN